MQSPEVLSAIRRAAEANNISFEALRVGNAMNSVNPKTGAPEFGFFKDWLSGRFAEGMDGATPPASIPQENADGIDAPTFESLGFDPNGPGKWEAILRDPVGAWKANKINEQATSEAIDRYDRDSLVNGPGDAWRHGRGSQLMTEQLGPIRAKALGDAYERDTWDRNTDGERMMDLYNNQVGCQTRY
jgi:hypothetical protein